MSNWENGQYCSNGERNVVRAFSMDSTWDPMAYFEREHFSFLICQIAVRPSPSCFAWVHSHCPGLGWVGRLPGFVPSLGQNESPCSVIGSTRRPGMHPLDFASGLLELKEQPVRMGMSPRAQPNWLDQQCLPVALHMTIQNSVSVWGQSDHQTPTTATTSTAIATISWVFSVCPVLS